MKPSTSCMVMLAVVGITACKCGNYTSHSPQEESHCTYRNSHKDKWEFYRDI